MDLILQEVSQERYIEIPEEVREMYKHEGVSLARLHWRLCQKLISWSS